MAPSGPEAVLELLEPYRRRFLALIAKKAAAKTATRIAATVNKWSDGIGGMAPDGADVLVSWAVEPVADSAVVAVIEPTVVIVLAGPRR